jgi:hypothetical protein
MTTLMTASKTAAPKLYQDFIAKKYFALSGGMQMVYGSFDTYLNTFIANSGFSEWLETMRDCELEEYFVEHIAHTFVRYGNREPAEIASVLAYIARQYNVELPVVEGILTPRFWQDIAYYNLWVIPESVAA